MLWVINLRITLLKLLKRTWELFFLVKGIVSKLVSLHYRLFTWKLVPSFIWSLCCWALLNCSLKHGVDLLECIQSGPKKKSKKKLLKVNFFLELWSSHLTTAHYNSLLVYVQYILQHGAGNKEKNVILLSAMTMTKKYIGATVRMLPRRMNLKNGFLLMWSHQMRLVLPLRILEH